MGDGAQPSATDDRPADVTVIATKLRLACVQRQPDPQRPALRPRFLSKSTLRVEGSSQRIRRPGKHTHHAVALALFHRPHPTMERDRRVEQFVVAGDNRPHHLLVTCPETSRSLNVAQEEGDHPGREGTAASRGHHRDFIIDSCR
jgi:hypothetical protein